MHAKQETILVWGNFLFTSLLNPHYEANDYQKEEDLLLVVVRMTLFLLTPVLKLMLKLEKLSSLTNWLVRYQSFILSPIQIVTCKLNK